MEKWVLSLTGYLELIDELTHEVIARQKRRRPPRTIRSGGRGPGRPSKEELALVERGEPIRRQHIYEYDPVVGAAIYDAIIAGGYLRTLDSKLGFPPVREILRWRKIYPAFEGMLQEAEEIRREREKNSIKSIKIESRGRPLGSKKKQKLILVVGPPAPSNEINWDDIPQVFASFGSWEGASAERKLTQK